MPRLYAPQLASAIRAALTMRVGERGQPLSAFEEKLNVRNVASWLIETIRRRQTIRMHQNLLDSMSMICTPESSAAPLPIAAERPAL